jgi:hypothetical protein
LIFFQKSPKKMYSKWRNLVRTYKDVVKSNRKSIKFAFFNEMKEALQHRPTEDLFKKDKKHKILPTTVQEPPVKRARSILLSTTVEENIEENEDLLTDDPMSNRLEPPTPTSYATHSTIMEHEPQQQVMNVRNECDVTLEEEEYQSDMQNSLNNTVNHIVEDDIVEDHDQDEVRIRIVCDVFHL